MYHPSLDELKKLPKTGNMIPVYREIMADLETPVSAFLKIHRGGRAFLLESVEGGERLARYSYIGTQPFRILETQAGDDVDILDQAAAEMQKYSFVALDGLPRFCGGAVGFLSYEMVTCYENIASPGKDPLGLPRAVLLFVDTLLVFDHVAHKIKVLSHVRLNGGNVDSEYAAAVRRIEELVGLLDQPVAPAPVGGKATDVGELVSNFSQSDFESAVGQVKRYITAGEAIQVVISQRLSKPTDASAFQIYRALRSINPSPYMFYLDMGDYQLVGASPEILVRVEDGLVMTRPLAGTRPRGKTPVEDLALEEDLRRDEKEKAEHIMLVDLGRNDIGRVCQPGTVEVSDLMNVERYSHVMHLVTHVQGRLCPEKNAFDALRACFPAGTVSGAPKIQAMKIIAELEPEKRGPYAGAAGYFSFSGNMDMAITIRTIVVKNGTAYAQAGCGVVYDSLPANEYQETLNKAQALLKAICQAEGN